MHSPGPWRIGDPVRGYKFCVYSEDRDAVADVPDTTCTGTLAQANARLIAAAPELYELLSSIENDDNSIPAGLWERIQRTLASIREGN